jgi:hypothetical protein
MSAFIDIGGLAAGMIEVILIGLWMCDELTFNQSFLFVAWDYSDLRPL